MVTRWLVVVVVLAVVLGVGEGVAKPRTAYAATIASDACGGTSVPNTYCSFSGDGSNVVIGSLSCLGTGACLNIGNGVKIGDNSCVGENACNGVGKGTSIGSNSCNGKDVCRDTGSGGGSSAIGDGSCSGGDSACNGAGGDGGLSVIGNGSCIGATACNLAGGGGSTSSSRIGNKSCIGEDACRSSGVQGRSTIGNDSCYDIKACKSAGFFSNTTIGNNSCRGAQSCDVTDSFGDVNRIGSYSCHDILACYTSQSGANVTVGDCMNNLGTTGCIVIVKQGAPEGSTEFSFVMQGNLGTCGPDTAPGDGFILIDDGTSANTEGCARVPVNNPVVVTETPSNGWTLSYINCVVRGNATVDVTGALGNSDFQPGDDRVNIQLVSDNDLVTCTFTNTESSVTPGPLPPQTLTVRKLLFPFWDAGRFDLLVDGEVEASAVGFNGSTGAVAVSAGPNVIAESGAGDTSVTDYRPAVVCFQAGSGIVGYGFGPSFVVNVEPNQNVTCVFINRSLRSWFWWR